MRITALQNGPYKVEQARELELLDADGQPVPIERDTVFLCRCGGSTTKPFCDGTHSKIGFQGALAAVRRSES
jgi:3-phenylpropionate/trans-cinnamate dioxygenase ferredoxin subunit